MRTRSGLRYPRVVEDKNMRDVKRRDFAAEQDSDRKRSRNSSNITGKHGLFDSLPDDLVISVLCKLSLSDFANVRLTCRRLNGLVLNSLKQPDSRQRIVNQIMETLKRHLPVSGQEGLHEFIATMLEEKIYTAATSQADYLRKISLKMLTMETKSQNPLGNALPSNSAGNSN
ncbi:uncharacterized protein LOC142634372 isoform X2 [Castanea sativa]|uniref:uncharacterized protein LOC142634372 isoform X2 n=1 Tax=Castanea sativa TaxID=21020 RepID=UPI003F64A80D